MDHAAYGRLVQVFRDAPTLERKLRAEDALWAFRRKSGNRNS